MPFPSEHDIRVRIAITLQPITRCEILKVHHCTVSHLNFINTKCHITSYRRGQGWKGKQIKNRVNIKSVLGGNEIGVNNRLIHTFNELHVI